MNAFSKKKILSMVTDLQDAVKTLKKEKGDELDPIWTENMGMFLLLINMLRDHFASQDQEYQVCIAVIDDFCREGEKIVQGSPDWTERQQICKELSRLLKKLQFEAKKAVPEDKKELVFFPYLYAMWDSLESIWKAAVDSGEFEVSVVLIPYYERKADGSLGELHYDGAEYPQEVQIIPWESYNVAERKPHVAYVHNPYDDCNRVTSIHPNFYSDKLKPYVGSLVYVPYFIGVNNQVPDHFCVTPATLLADKIIGQSEEVKETYVDCIYSFLQKQDIKLSKSKIEEKVLALGCPKLDSKGRSKEDVLPQLPEQWVPMLRKQDGSMQTVVFFNLSITSLLGNENALEKWRHSLSVFRQRSDEIALWWRPHPLLESTLVSMRPTQLREYQEMVDSYRQEGWGIFDDCMEFHTAVEFCDAYYGDPSSVVEVFLGVKKPVMIQNYDVKAEIKKVKK